MNGTKLFWSPPEILQNILHFTVPDLLQVQEETNTRLKQVIETEEMSFRFDFPLIYCNEYGC